MKKLLIAVLAVITIASCTKSNPEENLVPINFGSGLLVSTKAPITSGETGLVEAQLTGVQILRAADGSSAVWDTVSSVRTTATIDTDGDVTPASTQYYNADGTKAWLMGYYPAATSLAANKASWTIDGDQDIIVAPSTDAGTKNDNPLPTVALAFKLKLTQVQFKVKAQDAAAIDFWGTLTYIKVNAATKLQLTLSNNTSAASALAAASEPDATDLTTKGVTFPVTFETHATNYDAGYLMVLPTVLGAVKVKTSKGTEQTISVSGLEGDTEGVPNALVAGKAYEITLTFTATGITMTATVTAWATGDPGTGTVQ
ncbi:MAG: fimbrillin family protein [Bacteroidales bacterium]|nr:fimbrillin family protein [Bacteroidales bacterium]